MEFTKTYFDARLKASRSSWRATPARFSRRATAGRFFRRALALAEPLRVVAVLLLAEFLFPQGTTAQTAPAVTNACVTCHAKEQDQRVGTPAFLCCANDVHRENGFKCADCHGGNPAATDKARAHDPAQQFRGRPAGQAIVGTCARCHSDATFMRGF